MAFEGRHIALAGLAEIVLPGATVRLCDGGFVDWPARGMFTAKDDDFGTIESVEPVGEQVADEAPGARLTLLPPEASAAGDLADPEAQGGAVRFWLAELDVASGALIGTPELMFDGLIDTVSLRIGRGIRNVVIEFMAAAERLFAVKEGNVLSTRFHQTAWPGEKGFDHCTGAGVAVPWGVPSPNRGTVDGGSIIGGGSGGGGFFGGTSNL